MVRLTAMATGIAILLCCSIATAKDKAPAKAPAPVEAQVAPPVQDCSEFFESSETRGFGWGSSPAAGIGAGLFEGAMSTYSSNSFPDWHGDCATHGHYSATGFGR